MFLDYFKTHQFPCLFTHNLQNKIYAKKETPALCAL